MVCSVGNVESLLYIVSCSFISLFFNSILDEIKCVFSITFNAVHMSLAISFFPFIMATPN